jgi:hypothetical protein
MKDQYVGDINDYFKYSVLRALAEEHTRSLLVCWMLTANDDRTDGRQVAYLRDPRRYRSVDPLLFDMLQGLVARGNRSTQFVESSGILPGATFFRRRLGDSHASRSEFLAGLWAHAAEHRMVFFDPDNGLSVESTPCGRAGSRRYVYPADLAPLRDLNAAAVIYQHFPRVSRERYVAAQLARLRDAIPGYVTLAIYTSHVALLVATPGDQLEGFSGAFGLATKRWAGQITATAPR